MARASEQEQKGSTGVSEVTAKFTRLGWGFAEITRHDNGSDLFLMARDARRFDLGLTVGAQVKAGPSYFKEPAINDEGRLQGWWFRDSDSEHVTDWLRHGLPHIVVIHDLDTQVSYWVHVTSEAVVATGKGSKILVPATSTVDEAHRDALLAVAASLRSAAMWEGSAWLGVSSLPTKDALRHALLVPRLIAPHPNAGQAVAIRPEQGVALLMQARLHDLAQFAKDHDEVPTLDQALSSPNWTWRFVGLLGQRVTTGDVDVLQHSLNDAPNAASRVAATVAAVAGLLEDDRPDAAIDLLEQALDKDDAEPVDHAWLTVQYARALAEVGRLPEAKSHAAGVQSLRATHPDDVTATALAGVAAQLLFGISDWGEGDLASAVMGADTAASWWRQQTRSWGLSATLDRTFQRWARDTTHRWSVGDFANDQLLAASLTATLAGSRDAWRDITGLLGRDTLIRLTRTSEPAAAAAGLATLRLAGDQEAVKLAARRLVSDGPCLAVTDAVRQIDLAASTRTTGPTNLVLLQEAGGVLDEGTADRALTWILDTLSNPAAFVGRTTPSDWVPLRLLEALAAVAQSASHGSRRSLAEHVLRLDPVDDQLLAQTWARVVSVLASVWTSTDAIELTRVADSHHDKLRVSLLGVAATFDEHVRGGLLEAVRAGSTDALEQFGDVRDLPTPIVEARVTKCVAHLAQIAASAASHSFGVGGADPADELTLLGMWHPDSARWDALAAFLSDPAVSGRDKFRALLRMARQVELLPDKVREDLRSLMPTLTRKGGTSPADDFMGTAATATGAASLLMAALAGQSDADAAADVHRLLAGGPEGRVWAARIAQQRGGSVDIGVLTTLLHDDSPQVRAAAAVGLSAIATAEDGNSLAEAGVTAALADPGRVVPLAVAQHLVSTSSLNDFGQRTLAALRTHVHSSVRRLAEA